MHERRRRTHDCDDDITHNNGSRSYRSLSFLVRLLEIRNEIDGSDFERADVPDMQESAVGSKHTMFRAKMLGSKGVTTQLVAILIVLIVLAVGVYFIWNYIAKNANIDLNPFNWGAGGSTPNAPEAIVLENAIKCSYYRCVNGCNSDDVKKLQYDVGGLSFDCLKFCDPAWTNNGKSDGKICDDSAKQHPVIASVGAKGGEKITTNKINFAACFEETDTCGLGYTIPKYIVIEKAAVLENTETKIYCALPGNRGSVPGFSALVINQGSYKIWTTSYSALGNGQATYICGGD